MSVPNTHSSPHTPSPIPTRGWDAIRSDFPALQQLIHGKPLAYLDNAATTQKPHQVLQSMDTHYRENNANVHRAVHTLASRATEAFESARDQVARFLHAASPSEIIFTRGTTESINLVAQSWGRSNLKPGDELLITESEHHSNLVPWQILAGQTGAKLRFLPIDPSTFSCEPADWDHWLRPRTRLFAFTHVSNVLGHANPVANWCHQARLRGVTTLVDAAQSTGHLPVDVQSLKCDFLAFSGHKCCGPTGIGVLYGLSSLLNTMPPWQGGGEMIASVSLENSTFASPPQRFEAGTPPITEAIGLASALEYLQSIGLDTIEERNRELAHAAWIQLREIPGIQFLGNPEHSTGLLSFTLAGLHAYDVAAYADAEGIALRAGHHCAQPLLQRLKLDGALRASFHFYNTHEEVDRLTTMLHRASKDLA